MADRHALLRAELAAASIELRVAPHVLVENRDSGAGLLDALTITAWRPGQEPLDLIGTIFRPLPEMHSRHGRTRGTGSFAVPVDSHAEARSEAARYDPVPVFARYLIEMWRWSMPPWSYYPAEAGSGTHTSYASYRVATIRDGRFRTVIALAREFGEPTYERIEVAALCDAGRPAGRIAQESRFEYLRGLDVTDPNTDISAATLGKLVPALLSRHRVDDWGQLACPYCERFFPREELALVSYTEAAAVFSGVAWGCVDCTGGFAIDIPLDRMRTLDDAMRWTIHMLAKDWMQHPVALQGWIASLRGIFGQDCDLWAPGPV